MIVVYRAAYDMFPPFVERANLWGAVEATILDASTFELRFLGKDGGPYLVRISGSGFGQWLEDEHGAPLMPRVGVIERIERSWYTHPDEVAFEPAIEGLSLDVAALHPEVDFYDGRRLDVLEAIGNDPALVFGDASFDVAAAPWVSQTRPFDVAGTAGDESMSTADGDDRLRGLDGDDTLDGGGGDDVLIGGPGDDDLGGGEGDDILKGGDGNDRISGGPGADRLVGAGGDDFLFDLDAGSVARGGRGADVFADRTAYAWSGYASGGESGEALFKGGAGADELRGGGKMLGGGGRDMLVSDAGDQVMVGGKGKDLFVLSDRIGQDVIRDFRPSDTLLVLDPLIETLDDLLARMTEVKGGARLEIWNSGSVLFKNASLDDFTEKTVRFGVSDAIQVSGDVEPLVDRLFDDALSACLSSGLGNKAPAPGETVERIDVRLGDAGLGNGREAHIKAHLFGEFVFDERGRLVDGTLESMNADLYLDDLMGGSYFDRPLGENMQGFSVDLGALRLSDVYHDLNGDLARAMFDQLEIDGYIGLG